MRRRRLGSPVVAAILAAAFGSVLATSAVAQPPVGDAGGRSGGPCRAGSTNMARVELYFGAGHGGPRSWRTFLAHVVTPRFPDGFTSLDGYGQWRGRDGIAGEHSHVLVIFYRRDRTSEARIEAIRSAYRAAFAQASVLRADTAACVGL